MRGAKTIGLSLIAVFALATFASNAMALPEIGRCVAKAKGTYSESNCNTKAAKGSGTFEFIKGAEKTGFTAHGYRTYLETPEGKYTECREVTVTGKLDADGSGRSVAIKGVENVIATYTDCELSADRLLCNTPGQAGAIVTNELEGPLGYISQSKKEVGLELFPKVIRGAFTTFECGGGIFDAVVKEDGQGGDNCVIGAALVANEMSIQNYQVYRGQRGEQSPQHFGDKTSICNLEQETDGREGERASLTEEVDITFEEALEIKA